MKNVYALKSTVEEIGRGWHVMIHGFYRNGSKIYPSVSGMIFNARKVG